MTTTTSRRAVLAGAAVLPIATAGQGLAAVGHPDAELLALRDELEQKRAALDAVCDRHSREYAELIAHRPAQPQLCQLRPGDEKAVGLSIKCYRSDTEGGPETHILPHVIERLRNLGPEQEVWETTTSPDGELVGLVRSRCPTDQARAREIVDAYDRWRIELEAVDARFGVDKWDAETDSAMDELWQVERKISDTPAHTLEGLKVKALAALQVGEREDGDELAALAQAVLAVS